MNENNNKDNILSNYTISIRVGYDFQFIDLDVFAAICDTFLYNKIIELITQSPSNSFFYSFYRNKTEVVLHFSPKEN